jgi:RimJ/RimL family protein N-acetyltransferase
VSARPHDRKQRRSALAGNSVGNSRVRIELRPVTIGDQGLIEAVALDPQQEKFAGSVSTVFDELRQSRHPQFQHPFVLCANGEPVGFFVLREKQAVPAWATPDLVTLHSFRISRSYQGLGFGRAGIELTVAWLRRNRPGVSRLMLAVNVRNVLARALYLRCGFTSTGATHRGPIGEQDILAFDLARLSET